MSHQAEIGNAHKRESGKKSDKPLVSIIIPTYNRAHLIGETLDSILAQTYPHWECIIVDDGSTDRTDEVVQQYLKKDRRFFYYQRPLERPKGANACRNYGFEMSKGEYINWFDSDDLMVEENLYEKVWGITKSNVDFVIGNSINFGNIYFKKKRTYDLNYDLPISATNFIANLTTWITNDVLIKKTSVSIPFREELSFGQEVLFFAELLLMGKTGKFIKKDLAFRRVNPNSIQTQLLSKKNQINLPIQRFQYELKFMQYLSIYDEFIKNSLERSLIRAVRFSSMTRKQLLNERMQLVSLLYKWKGFYSATLYLLWLVIYLLSGRGYLLIKKINNEIKQG